MVGRSLSLSLSMKRLPKKTTVQNAPPARRPSSHFQRNSTSPEPRSILLNDSAAAERGRSVKSWGEARRHGPQGRQKRERDDRELGRLEREGEFFFPPSDKEKKRERAKSAPLPLFSSLPFYSTHLHRRHGHGRESQPSSQLVGVHVFCVVFLGGERIRRRKKS